MYISEERRRPAKENTGIQYIPGHRDDFVELIINHYLPERGEIADLGGGGLLFGINVALKQKPITVVDIDYDSLDIAEIARRVNSNKKMPIDTHKVQNFIRREEKDVFDFCRKTNTVFDLVTAFRLIHLFDQESIINFFRLVNTILRSDGIFVVSAMTCYNLTTNLQYNEFFLNSEPVNDENLLYRRFFDTESAKNIRYQQNLPQYIHMVNSNFICNLAYQHGFMVMEGSIKSTRVIEGYILKKIAVVK